MVSVEEFLKKFKEGQTSAFVQHELLSADSSEIELHSTLTSALRRGWHIAPDLGRSKHFSPKALAGDPTRSCVQVRSWAKQYLECGCNWAVENGARSGLLILESGYLLDATNPNQ